MDKVIKIALAAGATLAISAILSCSVFADNEGEKWCIIQLQTGVLNSKNCFKISTKATIYKNEIVCLATANSTVVEKSPKREECNIYDDASSKSKK